MILLALLALAAADAPVVVGVFPPAVATGGRQAWTVAGRGLDRATSARVEPADGLDLGPVVVAPDGRTLTVEVAARPDAAPGCRDLRLDGPAGLSNLAIVRVDTIPQLIEAEPNDVEPTQTLAVGTAVAGTLRRLDVDRFRIEGEPGRRVLLDWETRRLGSTIAPVLTATGPGHAALGQFRGDPGGDRDVRALLTIPPAGHLAVALRDNTYGGDDRARYRLRVVPAPAPPAPADPPPADPVDVDLGGGPATIRGLLAAPGRVDRYRVLAKAGDRLRARVEAAPLGSWLDAVVTIRAADGRVLAEVDDDPPASPLAPPATPDGSPSTDAMADATIAADGPVTIEVADRAGLGGPDFFYALEVGPPRADFALHLIPDPAAPDPAAAARLLTDPAAPNPPGRSGAYNLRPGTTTAVPFLIVPRGRPGTLEVRVEGLPPGVDAEPVLVRLAPAPRASSKAATAAWDAPPLLDSLRLRVAPDAPPTRAAFRVLARTRPAPGAPAIEHAATLTIGVDAAGNPGRPALRRLTAIPLRVLAAEAR